MVKDAIAFEACAASPGDKAFNAASSASIAPSPPPDPAAAALPPGLVASLLLLLLSGLLDATLLLTPAARPAPAVAAGARVLAVAVVALATLGRAGALEPPAEALLTVLVAVGARALRLPDVRAALAADGFTALADAGALLLDVTLVSAPLLPPVAAPVAELVSLPGLLLPAVPQGFELLADFSLVAAVPAAAGGVAAVPAGDLPAAAAAGFVLLLLLLVLVAVPAFGLAVARFSLGTADFASAAPPPTAAPAVAGFAALLPE